MPLDHQKRQKQSPAQIQSNLTNIHRLRLIFYFQLVIIKGTWRNDYY